MLGILLMRVRSSGLCWWRRGWRDRRGSLGPLGQRGRLGLPVLRVLLGRRGLL
jgi:hypothetical protein